MSVLFKSPSSSGGTIGGSSKGFPPGDVINISYRSDNQKIQIKWTDPDDTIIDGITIAKWKGTLLIRNSDHYPTSIKDGDIVIDNIEKNKYKDIFYEDMGLTNNTTYYYRFFTYSEDKVYNDSGNLVFKANPIFVDPVFKNNSWEQIIAASEANSIPPTWKIKDEIDITLSGTFNETVTLQIWDFNHFDKTDGTGKAGICFGMKNLMKNKQRTSLNDNVNKGGWNACYMRNTVMNNIYNSIPVEIRNHIKEVKTEANSGGREYNYESLSCNDKIFLPGITEVGGTGNNDGNQIKFPVFTNNTSRIKKLNNGTGSAEWWWTRSPYYNNAAYFCNVDPDGMTSQYNPRADYGVCFCFNI